jgi:cytochrome c biogenesis protein CcdA
VQLIGTLFVLFAPWILLVRHLSGFWIVDPQYSYGWAVPFMAAFFFWQRWRTCEVDPIRNESRWAAIGGIFAALLLAPI